MPTSVDSQRLPSPALRRFAWAVLAYFIAVILWGTLVRATGSGAGCGNHWPLCNGTVIQHSASVNTLIEFTHRVTSGLSFFAVVGLASVDLAGTVRGHLARWAAVASVVFTLIEALLGALLVKLGYTAQSQSPLRPAFLALHLANTLLLVAALTLTAHLLSRKRGFLRGSSPPQSALRCRRRHLRGDARRRHRLAGRARRYALPGQFAGPGAGPGFFSGERLAGALALGASGHRLCGQLLPHLAAGACRARADSKTHWDNRGLSALVLLLLAAVYALGLLDVLLLAPFWVQVAHLLAADTLWAALVVLTARLTLEPVEA